MVWLIGWMRPLAPAETGSVGSARSSARRAASAARTSSALRASSAAAMSSFSALTRAPESRRCSAGRLPSCRISAVSAPLRPRYLIRTASSASSDAAAARSPVKSLRTRSLSSIAPSQKQRGRVPAPFRSYHAVSGPQQAGSEVNRRAISGCRRLRPVERRFRRRDDLGKCARLAHREVRQNLAVELHPGELEPVHELRIGQAVLARSGIDPLDPQAAKVALAVAAVAIGVAQRLLDPFERDAIGGAAAAAIALGELEHLLVARMRGDPALDPGHRLSPSYTACRSVPAWRRRVPGSSCRGAGACPVSTCWSAGGACSPSCA